jgi:hypothetical protein
VSIRSGAAQRNTKPLPTVAFGSPRASQAPKPKASASLVSPRPPAVLHVRMAVFMSIDPPRRDKPLEQQTLMPEA